MASVKRDSYFGLNANLAFFDDTNTESPKEIAIGILQDCKFELTYEVNPMYGCGSTVYQAVARGKMEAKVECTAGAFNLGGLAKIINPDWTEGESGTTTVEVKQRTKESVNGDTTKVFNKFRITADVEGQDGVKLTITVGGIYFENFPFDITSDDWIKLNLTGMGNSFKLVQKDTSTVINSYGDI